MPSWGAACCAPTFSLVPQFLIAPTPGPTELRPVPSGIVRADGEPVIRTDVIHQLPRDPGRSDVEMFLDATRAPVLTESAAATLRGVLESTCGLVGEGGILLVDLWRARRASRNLLLQPREQWRDGPSTATTRFPGYAPESVPYNPDQFRSDEVLIQRMTSASLGDAARGTWANFD